jgi:hypothetical protein
MAPVAGINSDNRDNSLAGFNGREDTRERRDCARATENSPLALFAEAEASRPSRRRREPPVAHLCYGRFDLEVERAIEIVRPELSDLEEAELQRLLAKHADTREGGCRPS